MRLMFSDHPGFRERHLRRRHNNPLFGVAAAVDPDQLRQAKLEDQAELEGFQETLVALLEEAVNLPAKAESDQILGLKERLDKAYEQAAGLVGDQARVLEAINRLLGVVMQAVWKGAGNDLAAREALEQEEQARRLHQELLQHQLIADLLNPQTPIPAEELAASLLSESEKALTAALQLFDAPQLEQLCADSRRLLQTLDADSAVLEQARQRLQQLEAVLEPPGLH